jgi:WD40 repeat protein
VWDPSTGKETCAPLVGHGSWVTSLAWEPLHQCGGNADQACELLASSSKDKTVSGAPVALLSCSGCVVMLTSEARVELSCHPFQVRVWNIRTGRLQFTLTGHTDSIESVRDLIIACAAAGAIVGLPPRKLFFPRMPPPPFLLTRCAGVAKASSTRAAVIGSSTCGRSKEVWRAGRFSSSLCTRCL